MKWIQCVARKYVTPLCLQFAARSDSRTCICLHYFYTWKMRKKGWIYFRHMFDAWLFKPKQSVTSFFFYEKSGLHIIISFNVPTSPTYICTSSVDVQLYIRKYSPFGKHRKRLLYVRESDRAANWRHSGVTYFLATLSHEIWIFLEFKACNFRKGPGIYSILTYGVYTYGVYTYGVYTYGMYQARLWLQKLGVDTSMG